jgi:Flp pilus assembly protein TadG
MLYQWTANYAGYIIVNVQSSTTSNQYIQVTWTSNGINYSNKITVGDTGTAVFPVLPANNVQITIANTNLLNGATATVNITYIY